MYFLSHLIVLLHSEIKRSQENAKNEPSSPLQQFSRHFIAWSFNAEIHEDLRDSWVERLEGLVYHATYLCCFSILIYFGLVISEFILTLIFKSIKNAFLSLFMSIAHYQSSIWNTTKPHSKRTSGFEYAPSDFNEPLQFNYVREFFPESEQETDVLHYNDSLVFIPSSPPTWKVLPLKQDISIAGSESSVEKAPVTLHKTRNFFFTEKYVESSDTGDICHEKVVPKELVKECEKIDEAAGQSPTDDFIPSASDDVSEEEEETNVQNFLSADVRI